ncbi:hypothetical protein BAC2_01338 [uncultured bacterium]|nr:hypothetical protein BAC2_01338 [uncultured bacterium]
MTSQTSASDWNAVLANEFAKESDRAAVILTSAILERVLESLLCKRLAPPSDHPDELFQGRGPASGLSAKIAFAYRLGLISSGFRRDLDLIRRIRNEFAHNVHGCSFESQGVQSRVLALSTSSGLQDRCKPIRDLLPPGTRHDFLFIASWLLHSLNQTIESVEPIREAAPEFGYTYSITAAETEQIRAELQKP